MVVAVPSPVTIPGRYLLAPHVKAEAILSSMKESEEISSLRSKDSSRISTYALPILSISLKSITTLGILISKFISLSLYPITGTFSNTPISN